MKKNKGGIKMNVNGQQMVEYIILFAVVVLVVIFAIAPGKDGFLYRGIGSSMDTAVEGLECMTTSVCYEEGPRACEPACGDGCCQKTGVSPEDAGNCPEDCRPTDLPVWEFP